MPVSRAWTLSFCFRRCRGCVALAWSSDSVSARAARLPKEWPIIRLRILRRDGGRCTAVDVGGVRCSAFATDVDHIERGDNHADSNLRSLCGGHHRAKTAREGNEAMRAARAEISSRFRRDEVHPAFL